VNECFDPQEGSALVARLDTAGVTQGHIEHKDISNHIAKPPAAH
jgi:hypothetical protein